MNDCPKCGRSYFKEDHVCTDQQPRSNRYYPSRELTNYIYAEPYKPKRPVGRPPKWDSLTPQERKAMWNKGYRERGTHVTLGLRTEDRDAIQHLAKIEGISIIDMVHKLIASYNEDC